ncbi:MAG: GAF domain-containing protein [Chloroflexi bacterium]|nr:GAF domain-containing protein [Chloroflexota bacterium]MBI3339663.1 GAF domain-containing protein [Chloroflexota bacterium]
MSVPNRQPLPGNLSTNTLPPKARGRWIFGRRLSLGIKLPLMVIILLLFAFLISTLLSVNAAQSALTDTLQGELTAQTASKAELIRSNLIWTRGVAIDLAAAAEVNNYDEAGIMNTIRNTLARNKQIYGSTIAYEPYRFQPSYYYWSPYFSRTTGSDLRFTQLGNPDYNYFKWDWYTLPKAKGVPVLSPPYFDKGGGEIWMVTWSAPFFDSAGEVKGVATADIAFSQTQDIVNQIAVGKNGYAFLLDSKGVIMGIGGNGGKYQTMVDTMFTAAQSPQAKGVTDLVSSMTSGKSGFTKVVDAQGRTVYVAYAPVGLETGWSLGLAYPQAELFQKASQLQQTLIIYASLIAIVFGLILYLFTRSITRPIQRLTTHASRISAEQLHLVKGQLSASIQIQTGDELEDLGKALNQMAADLTRAFDTMEDRIAERTQALERRALQLKVAADVGNAAASMRSLDILLKQIVQLISLRFGFYHAGIFLLDEKNEYAVLRAANSEGGRQMLARGHKLQVGHEGIVGNVSQTGLPRIALDVGQDAVFFDNPDLPDTHSEMALPIITSSKIIGVLDVQSTDQAAFTEDDATTLQIVADQLAAAIENSRLLAESQNAAELTRRAYGEVAVRAWQDRLKAHPSQGYRSSGPGTAVQIDENVAWTQDASQCALEGKVIASNDGATLHVPILIRGQAIGILKLEKPNQMQWTGIETQAVQSLSDQLSGALDSARLYDDSQKRAVKEKIISDATARVGSALDIENILRATVDELNRALGGSSEIVLQLLPDANN